MKVEEKLTWEEATTPPTASPGEEEFWTCLSWPQPAEGEEGGQEFIVDASVPTLLPHTQAALVSFHTEIPGVTAWGWNGQEAVWEQLLLPGLLKPRHQFLAFLPPVGLEAAVGLPVLCFLEWFYWEKIKAWFFKLEVREYPPSVLDDIYTGPFITLRCGATTITVYEREDKEGVVTVPMSNTAKMTKAKIDNARLLLMATTKNAARRKLAAKLDQVIHCATKPPECFFVGKPGKVRYRIDVDDQNVRGDQDNIYVDLYIGVTAYAPFEIKCVRHPK